MGLPRSADAELGHAALQTPLGDLEGFDHRVEIAAAPLEALFDLLPAQVGRLADGWTLFNPIVEGGAGDTELGRGGLQAPAVGAQGGEELLFPHVLGTAIGTAHGAPGGGAAARRLGD